MRVLFFNDQGPCVAADVTHAAVSLAHTIVTMQLGVCLLAAASAVCTDTIGYWFVAWAHYRNLIVVGTRVIGGPHPRCMTLPH